MVTGVEEEADVAAVAVRWETWQRGFFAAVSGTAVLEWTRTLGYSHVKAAAVAAGVALFVAAVETCGSRLIARAAFASGDAFRIAPTRAMIATPILLVLFAAAHSFLFGTAAPVIDTFAAMLLFLVLITAFFAHTRRGALLFLGLNLALLFVGLLKAGRFSPLLLPRSGFAWIGALFFRHAIATFQAHEVEPNEAPARQIERITALTALLAVWFLPFLLVPPALGPLRGGTAPRAVPQALSLPDSSAISPLLLLAGAIAVLVAISLYRYAKNAKEEPISPEEPLDALGMATASAEAAPEAKPRAFQPGGPAGEIVRAYHRTLDRLAQLGCRRNPEETVHEYWTRLVSERESLKQPFLELTEIYEQARYGDKAIAPETAIDFKSRMDALLGALNV